MTWPRITANDWLSMIRAQREAARADLGTYQGAQDLPRLNVDQGVALLWYYERPFGSSDNWATTVSDQWMVALVKPDDKGKPTRSFTDVLDVGEALALWTSLASRADQLDPMCAMQATPAPGFPTPPTIDVKYVGHCPKDFKYDSGTTAQLRRVERVALAIQRVLKVIRPPPVTDIIGGLLKLAVWALIAAAVVGEDKQQRRRN